jgi:hypothetical protein
MYPAWCNNRIGDGYRKRLTMVLTLYAELVISSMLYIRNWVQALSNAICQHACERNIRGIVQMQFAANFLYQKLTRIGNETAHN